MGFQWLLVFFNRSEKSGFFVLYGFFKGEGGEKKPPKVGALEGSYIR